MTYELHDRYLDEDIETICNMGFEMIANLSRFEVEQLSDSAFERSDLHIYAEVPVGLMLISNATYQEINDAPRFFIFTMI